MTIPIPPHFAALPAVSDADAIAKVRASEHTSKDAGDLADRLEAANAREAELRELLERAQEEMRLINMKDCGSIYDPGLRVSIDMALSRPSAGWPAWLVDSVRAFRFFLDDMRHAAEENLREWEDGQWRFTLEMWEAEWPEDYAVWKARSAQYANILQSLRDEASR